MPGSEQYPPPVASSDQTELRLFFTQSGSSAADVPRSTPGSATNRVSGPNDAHDGVPARECSPRGVPVARWS